MVISLFIPKGKDKKEFIKQELLSASNIRNRVKRTEVELGLKKILESYSDGWFYLWDGKILWHSQYDGKDFIYRCGREFKIPDMGFEGRYGLVVFDLRECHIAELRGKRIITLWQDESNVPGKQGSGGQSAPRFSRIRDEKINLWYKKIAKKMQELWYY